MSEGVQGVRPNAETIFVTVSLITARGMFGIGLPDSAAHTDTLSNPYRAANRSPSPDPYSDNRARLSVPYAYAFQ